MATVRAKIFIIGVRESAGLNKIILKFGVRGEYNKVR
jgi:hypothetical protein